jgi:hypothetical protein
VITASSQIYSQHFALIATHLNDPRKRDETAPSNRGTKEPESLKIGQDIGVLKIAYFPGAAGMRFGKALDEAIVDLNQQECHRLIVDLRGNIGGSLGFARLASYMCPGQIAIGHSLTPKRASSRAVVCCVSSAMTSTIIRQTAVHLYQKYCPKRGG